VPENLKFVYRSPHRLLPTAALRHDRGSDNVDGELSQVKSARLSEKLQLACLMEDTMGPYEKYRSFHPKGDQRNAGQVYGPSFQTEA